jgi:hypothetical protein
MGTYPWGPHGPQSGPNQVTPNPTPAYVPPAWPSAPAPFPSYGGQPAYGGGGGGGYVGTGGPRGKSYLLAILLSMFFGPFGLLYASKKVAVVMLLAVFGLTLSQVLLAPAAMIRASGGVIDFMANNALLDQMWSFAIFCSVIVSIFGVMRYNRALKKKK